MPQWTIYYDDGSTVTGSKKADWMKAPDTGVQVIVVHPDEQFPYPDPFPVDERHSTGIVACNKIKPNVIFYTGVDNYDPLNYGKVKTGSLMSNSEYFNIWNTAYGNS